jgi:hypothetical protein
MSGARVCLGCSSALARFAIQSHARRGPACVHINAAAHRHYVTALAVLARRLPRRPPAQLHAAQSRGYTSPTGTSAMHSNIVAQAPADRSWEVTFQ